MCVRSTALGACDCCLWHTTSHKFVRAGFCRPRLLLCSKQQAGPAAVGARTTDMPLAVQLVKFRRRCSCMPPHTAAQAVQQCVCSIAQHGVGRCWALCAPETPLVQPQVLSLLVFTLPWLLAMTASNSHSQLPCQARLSKVPKDAVFESCPFKP